MKVHELIAALAEQDQQAEVLFEGRDNYRNLMYDKVKDIGRSPGNLSRSTVTISIQQMDLASGR